MNSPASRSIACNACLLVGCVAFSVTWNASGAQAVAAPPTAGGGSVQAGPAPAKAPSRRTRPIFVCRVRGVVIFSDLPCGPAGEERSLRVAEPAPGGTAATAPAPPRAATRPRPEPRDPGTPDSRTLSVDDRCRRLRDQRDALDERMRTGYSAREAARLWNRWRELDAEIYAARCHGT